MPTGKTENRYKGLFLSRLPPDTRQNFDRRRKANLPASEQVGGIPLDAFLFAASIEPSEALHYQDFGFYQLNQINTGNPVPDIHRGFLRVAKNEPKLQGKVVYRLNVSQALYAPVQERFIAPIVESEEGREIDKDNLIGLIHHEAFKALSWWLATRPGPKLKTP